MSLQTQLAMFVGGFVVCLALMIPLMSRWNEPAPQEPRSTVIPPNPIGQMPKSDRFKHTNSVKPAKKSWTVYLAPFYVFGVIAYVLYIVYRITLKKSKKGDGVVNLGSRNAANSQFKTALTHQEIGVLEDRLSASEKAVDEILQKARSMMTEVYQQDLEDEGSSLSDSSDLTESSDDEEPYPKISELVTTSSANNDTHQDTSSTSEGRILMHQRKKHKIKPHNDSGNVSSSSEEQNSSAMYHADVSDMNSPHLGSGEDVDDEDDSTTSDSSDISSEESEEENITSSRTTAAESLSSKKPEIEPQPDDISSLAEAAIDEIQTTCGTAASGGFAIEESVKQFDKTAENIGESLASESEKAQFLNDKEKLLRTTKEVLSTMDEIRDFLNEQKKN